MGTSTGMTYFSSDAKPDTSQTMVQEWNGSSWSLVGSPNPNGARYSVLGGVACPSATTGLATGSSDSHPLAERYA